jgi:hypothetical protein
VARPRIQQHRVNVLASILFAALVASERMVCSFLGRIVSSPGGSLFVSRTVAGRSLIFGARMCRRLRIRQRGTEVFSLSPRALLSISDGMRIAGSFFVTA